MKEYSYLKSVEMSVDDLKLGMYVSRLDKRWEESPFLFQGFPIETKEQLQLLKKECSRVYVDFKTQKEYDVFLLSAGSEFEADEARYGKPNSISLTKELSQAKDIIGKAVISNKLLMRQIMQGGAFDLSESLNSVELIIQSFCRNPSALLLLTSIRNKIHYTPEHNVRVAIFAISFGYYLKMSPEQIRLLGISAILHDIGKASIPEKILNKPGKLNKAEAIVLKDHPRESYKVLSRIKGLNSTIREVALTHHEREDGRGYPGHIPKERVSRFAKVVSLIDAYDAIVSDRAYGDARSSAHALKLLKQEQGKKFDADLVNKFIQWLGSAPIGTMLELVSGEVGIVIDKSQGPRAEPVILLVTDEERKKSYRSIIELARKPIHRNGSLYAIKSLLADHAYGINISQVLNKELFGAQGLCTDLVAAKSSPFSKYL